MILLTDSQEFSLVDDLLDAKLSINIKRWRKKRSLDANAYAWVLCDKIAKTINSTKEDVYRRAINAVGTFEPMIVEEKAFENFKRIWEKQGLGFLVEEVSKQNKCVKVHCYYGSSSYNTKEMSVLIDYIVQEAKELGIETMADNELNAILEAWQWVKGKVVNISTMIDI